MKPILLTIMVCAGLCANGQLFTNRFEINHINSLRFTNAVTLKDRPFSTGSHVQLGDNWYTSRETVTNQVVIPERGCAHPCLFAHLHREADSNKRTVITSVVSRTVLVVQWNGLHSITNDLVISQRTAYQSRTHEWRDEP